MRWVPLRQLTSKTTCLFPILRVGMNSKYSVVMKYSLNVIFRLHNKVSLHMIYAQVILLRWNIWFYSIKVLLNTFKRSTKIATWISVNSSERSFISLRSKQTVTIISLWSMFYRVRWLIDSGIFRNWHERLGYGRGSCWTSEHNNHLHVYKDLNIEDLIAIFYFLYIGVALAASCLLVETSYRVRCCHRKYKKK